MDGNVKVMISRLPSWVAVSIFNDKLFIKSDTLILIRNSFGFVFTPSLSLSLSGPYAAVTRLTPGRGTPPGSVCCH